MGLIRKGLLELPARARGWKGDMTLQRPQTEEGKRQKIQTGAASPA